MGMHGEQDVHGKPTCGTYTADQRAGCTWWTDVRDVHGGPTCGRTRRTDVWDVHGGPMCGTYAADRRTRRTDVRGTSAEDPRSEGAGTFGHKGRLCLDIS